MSIWLITGVTSGIGAALAEAVLNHGDTVIGVSRDAEALARFEALAPGRTQGLCLDIADTAQVESTALSLARRTDIDVLVNNAGQSVFGAFEETSAAEARSLIDVNLLGPWALTRALLPGFRARGGGTIVNLSSGCGLAGTPGLSAYCASKFALEGMTETLAHEVAPFGIRVMLVEPGAVATRFISHGTREAHDRVDAYAALSGQGKALLEGYYTAAACSPAKVAEAILTAMAQDTLPLRLLIGQDMREPLLRKAAEYRKLAGA